MPQKIAIVTGGRKGIGRAGLVSFKLDKLPSTEGKTVKLKIKYKSFASNDYNTVELDYKSKDTGDTEE